jgi:hypothetical protein
MKVASIILVELLPFKSYFQPDFSVTQMLQFIRDQLDAIEEGIKQSWISVLSGNPP